MKKEKKNLRKTYILENISLYIENICIYTCKDILIGTFDQTAIFLFKNNFFLFFIKNHSRLHILRGDFSRGTKLQIFVIPV